VGAFIDEWRVGSCSRRFSGLPDNITQTRVVYPRTGARSRRSRTWLYFCSAYTGRTYHRNPTYRRLAIAVYIALVVAVKVTNPLHREYFTTTVVATPFPHLSVYTGPLHWTAMGLSYALAFVGYFMLLELFTQIDLDTRALFFSLGSLAFPSCWILLGTPRPTSSTSPTSRWGRRLRCWCRIRLHRPVRGRPTGRRTGHTSYRT